MCKKISIIVPIYNSELYLRRCIDSIINQTYKNIEIILINDGSTDKSESICKEYVKVDKRIKLINKENSGQSDCRNIGTDNSSGDFIMYVDSDDELFNNACESLIEVQGKTNADLICFKNVVYKDGLKEPYREDSKYKILNSKEAYIEYMTTNNISCCLWSRLYSSRLAKSIKLPKGVLGEDIATTRNYLFAAKKIVVYDKYLYKYYIRNDSTMGIKKESHIINLYHITKDIYKFEISNFPNYDKIINTKYINNLLKVYANLYVRFNDDDAKQYSDKIDKELKKWNITKKLNLKTKIILVLFLLNKKIATNIILKYANR